MNHDACHCMDYEEGVCPGTCYRARLTDDYRKLRERGLVDFMTSWSHFGGTQYCKKDGDEHGI